MGDCGSVPALCAVIATMLCIHSWIKVDVEREYVERKDDGDDPFQNSGDVLSGTTNLGQHSKRDRERNGNEDKSEFDPKGNGQNPVFGVSHAQSLILPADKDCAEQVADDEETEKQIVQRRMARRVENAKQDQADGADQCPKDGQAGEDLFAACSVGYEATAVSQPAIGEEADVEEDGSEDAASDKERLEFLSADV